ncbi:MAG: hypothetical protein CR988_03920 [Treponema sp.]|nr:MAG: hypothetical protein CR988_03920 [Treponema sp.]
MRNIYKYEMIRRKNMINIFSAIMMGMTLVSIVIMMLFFESYFLHYAKHEANFAGIVWIVLTITALVGIPFVMMFLCSSGHTKELLYKDTNYLMLSIPIPSWKILLGRFLAGLTEIVIYTLVSFISGFTWICILIVRSNESLKEILNVLSMTIKSNITLAFVLILFILSFIALLGTVVMFVRTLTRSFIKRKKLAEFLAVILFILLFILVTDLMNDISTKLDWIVNMNATIYGISSSGIMSVHKTSMPLPVLLPLGYGLMSTIFFLTSAWLLKNKVEV